MAQMNISNTLYNDTSTGEIAYAEQLKDRTIDWTKEKYTKTYPNPQYDPLDPSKGPKDLPYFPESLRTNAGKFQSSLNDFFLDNWIAYMNFLTEKGVSGVIDTWKDVEDFLEGMSDSDIMTLVSVLTNSQYINGVSNIKMSDTINGLVTFETTATLPDYSESKIDDETGIIKLIYNFDINS